MTDTFRAYLLREDADRKVTGAFEDVPVTDLPDGDVTVRVAYTTVNYKDGMVMKGIGRASASGQVVKLGECKHAAMPRIPHPTFHRIAPPIVRIPVLGALEWIVKPGMVGFIP